MGVDPGRTSSRATSRLLASRATSFWPRSFMYFACDAASSRFVCATDVEPAELRRAAWNRAVTFAEMTMHSTAPMSVCQDPI